MSPFDTLYHRFPLNQRDTIGIMGIADNHFDYFQCCTGLGSYLIIVLAALEV